MNVATTDPVSERGYTLLAGYLPGLPTAEVASTLGEVSVVPGLAAVQSLKPRDKEHSPPNIYSGEFGTGEFPLHTDLAHWSTPPRYLVLRCVAGAPDVATRLLDGQRLIGEFGAAALRRTLVQPRRPTQGSRPLLRLLETPGHDQLRIRWDGLFLVPATRASAATFESVAACLSMEGRISVVLLNPGDTLVIDNWRMLHGRSAVPDHSRARYIERAYLNTLTPRA